MKPVKSHLSQIAPLATTRTMDKCDAESHHNEPQDHALYGNGWNHDANGESSTIRGQRPRDARTGLTPVQLLQRYQIRAIPASTNRFGLRKAAVARLLNRRRGCVIDPACTMLIYGLGRSYVHRRLRATATTGLEYANEPVKGPTSHVCEAFQYLALHVAHITPEEEAVQRSRVQVSKRRVV
ncbi:hypothetical protein PSAC2689_130077 [Paraburkholderia sacchari]|uniref:hypothetical protein n=1 Tax=Paraburkholderia sacchari TaxID=159450 RepID=UPI0039A6415A